MAGVTDLVYRRLARRMGCALTYTEFVSAAGVFFNPNKHQPILDIDSDEHPVSVQIFGNDIEQLVFTAQFVERLGADIVDINMGCPVPKVVKSGAGAALLKNPARVGEIIRAVKAAVRIPVTLKTRSGWDKENINVIEVARVAEAEGVAAIALHPRTRSMGHDGTPDWTVIREVKQAVSVPVIGNGGIRSPQDARRMLADTGCDFIMIGSGTIGNLDLIRRTVHYLESEVLLPEWSWPERLQLALEHARENCAYWGEPKGPREMRTLFSGYLKGFQGAAALRQQLNQAETLAAIEASLLPWIKSNALISMT